MKAVLNRWFFQTILLMVGSVGIAPEAIANDLYNPITIRSNQEISDVLSVEDIPTGEGGFARDYTIDLVAGDQVAIDAVSSDFDTFIMLMGEDGAKLAENDDGSDGSTNSLLFVRITETGKYVVRVRSFEATGSGDFSLKVTRLQAIPN